MSQERVKINPAYQLAADEIYYFEVKRDESKSAYEEHAKDCIFCDVTWAPGCPKVWASPCLTGEVLGYEWSTFILQVEDLKKTARGDNDIMVKHGLRKPQPIPKYIES